MGGLQEIASSLQKFRSNLGSSGGAVGGGGGGNEATTAPPEPPSAEFKQFHERSLYVAQKLKEDR